MCEFRSSWGAWLPRTHGPPSQEQTACIPVRSKEFGDKSCTVELTVPDSHHMHTTGPCCCHCSCPVLLELSSPSVPADSAHNPSVCPGSATPQALPCSPERDGEKPVITDNFGVERSLQEANLKSDGFLNEHFCGFSKALLGRTD